jgi:hypothetical protein
MYTEGIIIGELLLIFLLQLIQVMIFIIKIPVGGAYTKLKFTFYDGTGTDNWVGVSVYFLFILNQQDLTKDFYLLVCMREFQVM